MPDQDPKKDDKYYKNPDYTNEGLGKDLDARQRKAAQSDGSRPSGEYNLNPVAGEATSMAVERLLGEKAGAADDSPEKKRTLHDPRKFEELLKDRIGDIEQGSPDIQRITNPEIEALRTSSLRGQAADVQAKQKMASFFQNLGAAIGGIFCKEKKKHQCQMYGHIAPSNWHGDFPNCTECGAEIRSQDELRKASARQEDQEIKPYDNRLSD